MQMLNSNAISDIHIVMADCFKQLDVIIQKRLSANALNEREQEDDYFQQKFLKSNYIEDDPIQ